MNEAMARASAALLLVLLAVGLVVAPLIWSDAPETASNQARSALPGSPRP